MRVWLNTETLGVCHFLKTREPQAAQVFPGGWPTLTLPSQSQVLFLGRHGTMRLTCMGVEEKTKSLAPCKEENMQSIKGQYILRALTVTVRSLAWGRYSKAWSLHGDACGKMQLPKH